MKLLNPLSFFRKKKVENKFPQNNPIPAGASGVQSWLWDGEKTLGEMGLPKNLIANYQLLAIRSWQQYFKDNLAQLVIQNDALWVLGTGLSLKSEPVESLLPKEFDAEKFKSQTEDYFKVQRKSKYSSWNKNQNLDKLIYKARISKLVGGDVLYIFRYTSNRVSLQVVDGLNVINPIDSDQLKGIDERGNSVYHGVELDKNKTHVAYFVYDQDTMTTKRILARGAKNGRLYACLGYGNQYRVDEVRGMPILSACLETLNSLQRYKDASVMGAEERASVAYVAEHEKDTIAENPNQNAIDRAAAIGYTVKGQAAKAGFDGLALDPSLSARWAATTKKQFYNLPVGTTLKALESKSENYFKDFFLVNFGVLCASIQQPPEIALMSFNSNFSASRMAVKVWETMIEIKRENEANESYSPFWDISLEVGVRTGRIEAFGYLANQKNYLIKEAYEYNRFTGRPVPHIDPVKEVQAARLALGDQNIPLTSPQDVAENLGFGSLKSSLGEFNDIFELASELMKAKKEIDNAKVAGELVKGGTE